MDERKERLAARVKAVNLCNKAAGEVFAKLRAALVPFVGKPVTKVTGGLRENVKAAIPTFPEYDDRTSDGCRVRVTTNFSRYGFAWAVYVSAPVGDPNGEHTTMSHETTVWVGELDGTTLKKLNDTASVGRTDYTAEEIEKQRAKVAELERQYNDEKHKLSPFGEFDR